MLCKILSRRFHFPPLLCYVPGVSQDVQVDFWTGRLYRFHESMTIEIPPVVFILLFEKLNVLIEATGGSRYQIDTVVTSIPSKDVTTQQFHLFCEEVKGIGKGHNIIIYCCKADQAVAEKLGKRLECCGLIYSLVHSPPFKWPDLRRSEQTIILFTPDSARDRQYMSSAQAFFLSSPEGQCLLVTTDPSPSKSEDKTSSSSSSSSFSRLFAEFFSTFLSGPAPSISPTASPLDLSVGAEESFLPKSLRAFAYRTFSDDEDDDLQMSANQRDVISIACGVLPFLNATVFARQKYLLSVAIQTVRKEIVSHYGEAAAEGLYRSLLVESLLECGTLPRPTLQACLRDEILCLYGWPSNSFPLGVYWFLHQTPWVDLAFAMASWDLDTPCEILKQSDRNVVVIVFVTQELLQKLNSDREFIIQRELNVVMARASSKPTRVLLVTDDTNISTSNANIIDIRTARGWKTLHDQLLNRQGPPT